MYTEIRKPFPSDGAKDNTVSTLAQGDLIQALNQENGALANRIQELLTHIEVREEEIKKEETRLNENISKLQVDRIRLEQENQEQGCLITELTRKTEDDLNTIMELQQKLAEGEQQGDESLYVDEQCGFKMQGQCTAVPEGSQWNNQENEVESSVKKVLKEENTHLMVGQQSGSSATASGNHYDPSQSSPQSPPHFSLVTDQVDKLTRSVQSLRAEQEELSGIITSLREQQRDVTLSVQTQTELKQQLTRTVWGLKVEKDNICQYLDGLKQQQEQLTKVVRQLKDERDQFIRFARGLTEEKEQLTKALIDLKIEKEKLLESITNGKEERDQIACSRQSLQIERDQLNHEVLSLKEEKEKLSDSLKCLMGRGDGEKSSCTLEDDRDKLMKLISTLKEEKERIELSVSCLKQEKEQINLHRGPRQEGNSHKAALVNRMNPNNAVATKSETGTEEHTTPRCQANCDQGNTGQVLFES